MLSPFFFFLMKKFNKLVEESKQKDDDKRNLDVAYNKLTEVCRKSICKLKLCFKLH